MRHVDSLTERLAKALSHPVRAAVLEALEEQPRTPRQLCVVCPGFSLESVAQQCKRLRDLGLIEPVEDATPSAFRLVRGAAFDQASLEALGEQARTISGTIARNYAERIESARAESTFGNRADTRLLCATRYLDAQAWESLIPATDALLWRSFYLQIEASERIKTSKEKPIIVTTGFGCFVSPQVSPELGTPVPVIKCGLPGRGSRVTSGAASAELAEALSHPIRIAIIGALLKGPSSPTEVRNVNPEWPLSTIHKHFVRLEELTYIEKVADRWADGRSQFQLRRHSRTGSLYGLLPPQLRVEVDSVVASTYVERAVEAIASGTMKSRPEAHHTWSGLRYDEQAWGELTTEIDELFGYAMSLFAQAEDRHNRARRAFQPLDALMPVTFGLACFESPANSWALSDDEMRDLLARDDAPSRNALRGYETLITAAKSAPGGAAA